MRPGRHWLGSNGQRAPIAGSRSLFRKKGLRGPIEADARGDPDVQSVARKEDRALSCDLLKEMPGSSCASRLIDSSGIQAFECMSVLGSMQPIGLIGSSVSF